MYYGKYRAIVTKNSDPEGMDRIKVKCPIIFDEYESAWCLPCFPILDIIDKQALKLKIPKVGEAVWIEFEGGNTSKPIWVGTWKR